MAGQDLPLVHPYPTGDRSAVTVRLSGYAPNGLTTEILDCFYVPWNCKCTGVRRTMTSLNAAGGGDFVLRTIDDNKQLVADAASSDTDLVAVAQTLHSDIVNYEIQAGDKIKLQLDTQGTNEQGFHAVDIDLVPTFSGSVK